MPKSNCSRVKHLASSATVSTAGKAAILYSASIHSDNTDGKVIFKDGGSSGTTVLTLGQSVANQSTAYTTVNGIIFNTDIYATISGTGTESVTVEYEEIEK